jgi:hypothetical protein
MKKDDYLAVIVVLIVIGIFGTVAYLGYDFCVHIAKRVGYPVWKITIIYWFTVVLSVLGVIFQSK